MGCCCSKEKEAAHSVKSKSGMSYSKTSHETTPKKERNQTESDRYYVALWDYEKSSQAELSFRKGDVFKEIGDECDAGPEWLFVTQDEDSCSSSSKRSSTGSSKKSSTGTGYIPRNFIALRDSLEAESYWFENTSRYEADDLLRGKPEGMFLLRSRPGGEFMPQYALSVSYRGGKVKHYRIRCNQNLDAPVYSIASKASHDIRLLLTYFFGAKRNVLGCELTEPPPRPPPAKPTLSAEIEKKWQEIPRSQIRIECQIGHGFYGLVHRGTWGPAPGVTLVVAVKELKTGATEGRENFLAEAMAMKNLRHDRLVKLHGVVSADEPFLIITEFIKDGSLRVYLRRRAREANFLEEPQLIAIACQVAEGMRFLEEKKVVHRDLAARNVLIQEVENKSENLPPAKQFDVKIADFGLAQMIKSGTVMQEKRAINLPTKWLAPEALTEAEFSTATDVWAFGILLFEIFTHGREPYEGMTVYQARNYVVKEQKQLPRPPEMPEGVYILLTNCCEFNALARPMFQHIHCYLETYYKRGTYYSSYDKFRSTSTSLRASSTAG